MHILLHVFTIFFKNKKPNAHSAIIRSNTVFFLKASAPLMLLRKIPYSTIPYTVAPLMLLRKIPYST